MTRQLGPEDDEVFLSEPPRDYERERARILGDDDGDTSVRRTNLKLLAAKIPVSAQRAFLDAILGKVRIGRTSDDDDASEPDLGSVTLGKYADGDPYVTNIFVGAHPKLVGTPSKVVDEPETKQLGTVSDVRDGRVSVAWTSVQALRENGNAIGSRATIFSDQFSSAPIRIETQGDGTNVRVTFMGALSSSLFYDDTLNDHARQRYDELCTMKNWEVVLLRVTDA